MDENDKYSVKRDNPVGRLWHVLDSARHSAAGKLTVRALADAVLGRAPGSPAETLVQIAHFYELVSEAEAAYETVAANNKVFPQTFPRLLDVLGPGNLPEKWGDAHPNLADDATMTALALGAEVLSRTVNESPVEQQELDKLETEISGLIHQVSSGALREELKRLIVEQLETIRSAILHYRISGVDGIKRALERAVGAIVLQYDLYKEAKATEEIGKFDSIIGKVRSIVNLGLKMKTLAGPIARLFLPEEVDAGD